MPNYRYESVDASGVPIFGTVEVANEEEIEKHLSARGLKLVSFHELSVVSLIQASEKQSERLHQLGVSNFMREAFLTSLPADRALTALAAEPVSHPMLGIAAWAQLIAILFAAITLGLSLAFELPAFLKIGVLVVSLMVTPLFFVSVSWLYRWRPQAAMKSLARVLAIGQTQRSAGSLAFSKEVRGIMKADLSNEEKSRVAADLVPTLLGARMKSQQILLGIAGPIIFLSVIFVGFHILMITAIQQFRTLFESFGADLPAPTVQLFRLSDLLASAGMSGVLLTVLCVIAVCGGFLLVLSTRVLDDQLAGLPLFGVMFRLQMQSRVSRILSALIRSGCSYASAIKAATGVSGFSSVEAYGEVIAKRLNAGESQPDGQPAKLAGLPFSMLFVQPADVTKEERAISVAQTFHVQSEMLDNAAVGQGRLLAVFLQMFALVVGGLIFGSLMIIIYLPLFQLIRSLT